VHGVQAEELWHHGEQEEAAEKAGEEEIL